MSLRHGAMAASVLLLASIAAPSQTHTAVYLTPAPADVPAPSWNTASAPVFLLSPQSGAPAGKVWVRETAVGLAFLGMVDQPAPRDSFDSGYALYPAAMAERPYVSLWVAAAPTVSMPDVGWGNQFGPKTCDTAIPGGMEPMGVDCLTWARFQRQYREQLRRLFQRHWRITPDVTIETYATPALAAALAYASDSNDDHAALQMLAPRDQPRWGSPWGHRGPTRKMFEFTLPWSALPPANALALTHLWLNLQYCVRQGQCSSTAPVAKPDDPATWARLGLGQPHVASVTACDYPLQLRDVLDQPYPGWYLPQTAAQVHSMFALENHVGGYADGPIGLSPFPVAASLFAKQLSQTASLCGPALRFRAGSRSFGADGLLDPAHFSTHPLPNGALLLKAGPVTGTLSPLGSGQCGACPSVSIAMYVLDPVKGITHAGDASLVAEFISDGDIQLSSDWKTLTIYKQLTKMGADGMGVDPGWYFDRSCFDGTQYQPCGAGPSDPPPSPRQIPNAASILGN